MQSSETDMRTQIKNTVRELIENGQSTDKITVRTIAKNADVGVGLINYHFGSKDNLLETVLGEMMSETAEKYISGSINDDTVSDREKLKILVKSLYIMSVNHTEVTQFLVMRCLQRGDLGAELSILPLLKKIFEGKKKEIELRIMSMQIIKPIQASGLSPENFRIYSGFDLYDENQRNEFIDILVDNLI